MGLYYFYDQEKQPRLLKEAYCLEAEEYFLESPWQALGSRQASLRPYLNEMQHGKGEMLITETAVHHHLDERQERARQLSQGKHYL